MHIANMIVMQQIDYHQLDYQHKLLYLRNVFQEAQSAHSVYAKLATLLSGQWQLEEKHLDMLYSQVHSVIDNLHENNIIEKMGRLAARLEQIQRLEQIDRAREAVELQEMESILMKIPDDRPYSHLPHQ